MLRKRVLEAGMVACAKKLGKEEQIEDLQNIQLGSGSGERWLEGLHRKPCLGSCLAVLRKGGGPLLPRLSMALSCDFSGLGKFKVTVWGGDHLIRAGQLGSWDPCLPHGSATEVLLLRRLEWALFLYLWAV